MNANLERYVNQMYLELKDSFPEMSEFALKTAILDKLRAKANEQADAMICVHVLTEQVKALSALAAHL